ncbi:hypothetical protein V8G54_014216 [Vigna mungo]|uniref:chorismate mutase n=1 Tax=Vigna mungo TaxID=3915 RepID=A0AAQ3NH52_VIGMU
MVLQARRYDNPEENPFSPKNLPPIAAPKYPFSEFLQGAGASINIIKEIWEVYFHELLPKFVKSGDDGNYAQTAFADLTLLQGGRGSIGVRWLFDVDVIGTGSGDGVRGKGRSGSGGGDLWWLVL